MRQPSPETILALALRSAATARGGSVSTLCDSRLALDATRVVALAKRDRRLGELSCNQELTPRQEKDRDSVQMRANTLLAVYGLKMGNPWGLCRYAMPIDSDGCSSSNTIFLA